MTAIETAPSGNDELARQLSGLSVSLLSDVREGRGVLEPGFVRFSGTGVVAGRTVTADCDEGSLQPVFAALEQAGPGDFLCIRGPGNTAYLGDLLAANIVNRGLAGAVIDGLVRDRASIARSPATFVARGVTPVNLRRRDPGRAMVEVRVGGVAVSPGDWLVADDDGVIAIAPGEAAAAIAAALRMARVEKRIRELVLQRVPVPEAVRQALAEAGD